MAAVKKKAGKKEIPVNKKYLKEFKETILD